MLQTATPVLATALAPVDPASPAFPDFGTQLPQLAGQFNAAASQLLTMVDSSIIGLIRLAYITVLLLGVLLYFTKLQKRLGRDLITGGIVLAMLSELGFPAISRL